MSLLERGLLWLAEFASPPEVAECVAGDLAEEVATLRRTFGPVRANLWLTRQALECAVRSPVWRNDLLEWTAAAFLLVAFPFAMTLSLRRYVLTLVPHRDGAAFSPTAIGVLAFGLAGVGACAVVLLAPVRRRCLPVALSTALVGLVAASADTGLSTVQLVLLMTATWAGGSAATLRKAGGKG